MSEEENARILLVDDEPKVLDGLERHLALDYDVFKATGGRAGLDVLSEESDEQPFAMVISDMRMPEMNGAAFLAAVRQQHPDVTRVLLTGQSDFESAVAAVNDGQLFRFLTKPCPPSVLLQTVEAAIEQHRLITSEKILLEQTLRGAVQALTETLAMASPSAFGHAKRTEHRVTQILDQLGAEDRWPIEVAGMLASLPLITLPPDVLERYQKGAVLSAEERKMVARLPEVAVELLAPIPRLGPVREILRYQQKGFDGSGSPADDRRGEELPLGARILRAVLDMQALEARGLDAETIRDTLASRAKSYDPRVLQALFSRRQTAPQKVLRELLAKEIRAGMVIAEDVMTDNGAVLLAKGIEVTEALRMRLANFASRGSVQEPLRAYVIEAPAEERSVA
ncbi:MAG: response regulator [Deltaproteobacteria bacterium]|nr:response regulator [Deltaproteobacteria bacterium]